MAPEHETETEGNRKERHRQAQTLSNERGFPFAPGSFRPQHTEGAVCRASDPPKDAETQPFLSVRLSASPECARGVQAEARSRSRGQGSARPSAVLKRIA